MSPAVPPLAIVTAIVCPEQTSSSMLAGSTRVGLSPSICTFRRSRTIAAFAAATVHGGAATIIRPTLRSRRRRRSADAFDSGRAAAAGEVGDRRRRMAQAQQRRARAGRRAARRGRAGAPPRAARAPRGSCARGSRGRRWRAGSRRRASRRRTELLLEHEHDVGRAGGDERVRDRLRPLRVRDARAGHGRGRAAPHPSRAASGRGTPRPRPPRCESRDAGRRGPLSEPAPSSAPRR